MNVRFSEQAIRCRTSSAELEKLLTGRALTLELILPREEVPPFTPFLPRDAATYTVGTPPAAAPRQTAA